MRVELMMTEFLMTGGIMSDSFPEERMRFARVSLFPLRFFAKWKS